MLNYQWTFLIKRLLCADTFHFVSPVRTKEIETEAILFRINFLNQSLTKNGPLGGIDNTFKYGVLHSLTIIFACFGNTPQSSAATELTCFDIITHQNKHILSLYSISKLPEDNHRDPLSAIWITATPARRKTSRWPFFLREKDGSAHPVFCSGS